MKRIFLFSFVALATLFVSCQKEEMGRILTATIEQYQSDSKAYINDSNYACWENGDTVSINGTKYPISINDDAQTATITNTQGLSGDLLAYYPASQVTSWSGNNVTISLPQVQEYRENNGHQVIDNPMAAYCPAGSDELKFRNLGALLKVTIQAPNNEDLAVKTILVKGNDNQMLWGKAQLKLDYQNKPILGEISNGSASVFLHFKNPKAIPAGESKSFYIVVPDGSSFKNFIIAVATDQKVYRKETLLGHTLPRNHIGALTYAPDAADKVNAILYAGSIEGFDSEAFGDARVLSSDNSVILFGGPVTEIGRGAFNGCSSLTSITLPAGVTSIGDEAFSYCSSLTGITLPESLTSIRWRAFSYCRSLTSITLPDNLTTIGDDAFYWCSSLTGISLPAGVTTIGDEAFAECSSLTSISLPDNLTTIGDEAFAECSSLTSISLPAGVTSIGMIAFAGCSSLARVDCYATTPPDLGSNAFYNISSSAVLHVPTGKADTYSDSPWGTVFSGEGRIIDDL